MLVLVELRRTLARGNFDCCDFRGELAGSLSCRKALLRAFGPAILLFAGDLVGTCEVFGVPPGMLTGEGIIETIHQHRIEYFRITHAIAPAPGTHEIRGTVHVLHAAGDRAIDQAEHHLLRGARNRLRSRAANPVDRHCRNLDRDAAIDGRLPGRVHFVASLDHVAHDNRVDITGAEFRALKRRADYRGTEIYRRHIFQRAAIGADGRTHR